MTNKLHRLNKLQKGFTLIEMLVTLTIAAILISIAYPSLLELFKYWEARQTRSMIFDSYHTSKAESIIYNQNVIMCLADKEDVCHRDAEESILIFIDSDNDKQFKQQVDTMVSSSPINLDYGRLHLRVGAKRHYMKFFSNTGLPRGHFGHMKYCPTDNDATYMYQVSINHQGISRFKPHKSHDTGCP